MEAKRKAGDSFKAGQCGRTAGRYALLNYLWPAGSLLALPPS
ncbi:hypothetical protein AB395_00001224 [Sinorhizobium fredii CCBAU 45436]|nr:hypothetical protein SF83666_c11940 [Sinorhizobium fredii CCBAU 83666]AWI56892.1 hypothetical protein AB395_00001224 [Sinorhizobium fredii CCBAU 45436]AWM24696.1 hypothetical protein AOX55_00001429 [Sinorhizobium fredii CCBAU 25509]